MKEIWRNVVNYEGLYMVSNLGYVKSLGNGNARNPNWQKERILKSGKDKDGYLKVALFKDGKRKNYSVHRLVALAFLPNPNNLPQVNHINEIKNDNRVENLEWCSAKYNNNYGNHNKRVSESQTNYPKFSKQVLCVETGVVYPSLMQVKRELGFSISSISEVCLGKRKRKSAYGFHWRYID
jgi:hypothetical protein